ncbi:hypothetical protein ABW21_db0205882 [Orbilia brochopaga]|nr:hypothetical protein ABW21_db0205882 [Drechslerella brochopaga]
MALGEPMTPAAQEFKLVLEQAAKQRHHEYELVFAVSFYFENDDTDAAKDAASFIQSAQRNFGIEETNSFNIAIPAERMTTDFWYTSILTNILKTTGSCPGKKLLLLHYAGHGTEDAAEGLRLTEDLGPDSRFLPWERIRISLFEPVCLEGSSLEDTDLAIFLDCCYSGRAIREELLINRTVEVLAATDAPNTANSRTGGLSFTQRVITHMDNAMSPNKNCTLAGIFRTSTEPARLDSEAAVPTFCRLVGSVPIILPTNNKKQLESTTFLPPRLPSSLAQSIHAPASHSVALRIHIRSSITAVETEMLVEWLLNLPISYGVELNSVHEIYSRTSIMLTVSYEMMHVIFNLMKTGQIDVEIIQENIFFQNMLERFKQRSGAKAAVEHSTIEEV